MIKYKLEYPLNDDITEVTIRKPLVGELRGIKLMDLLSFDVAASEKLLPRISELTPRDVSQLDPYDFTNIMQHVIGFFVTSKDGSPMT